MQWLFEVFQDSLFACVFRQSLKPPTAPHVLHVKAEALEVAAAATFQASVHCCHLPTLSENH